MPEIFRNLDARVPRGNDGKDGDRFHNADQDRNSVTSYMLVSRSD